MKVIITEKPSVAKDIAKVLGISTRNQGYFENQNYFLTWAFGHLIGLSNPDEYDKKYEKWELEHLPIIPETFQKKLIGDDGTKRQFATIEALLKNPKATQVICATDAGREGELIFRLIYEKSGCKLPIKRLWISSQTDKAIKEGFEKLKSGDDYTPLYHAAKCRSEADWLVGINATRAYTIKCSRGAGVMSVGRVQTPVLKLIVDRYQENATFKSETFYELFAECKHENGNFTAKWFKDEKDEKTDRLKDKENAEALLQKLNNPTPNTGRITKLTQKKLKEKQPLLYDLTELQKDAHKKFKYSADQTLKLMQSLYETHKILSYPRTSSRYLTSDIAPQLPGLINTLSPLTEFTKTLTEIKSTGSKIASRLIDDKKVTDHHAIIPTDNPPNLSRLSAEEKNIYLTVIRRFLAAFLPECQKSHTEIQLKITEDRFKTTGTIILDAGWRALYQDQEENTAKKGKSKKPPEDALLPNVKEGDPVSTKTKLQEGKTKAPALHNEASILGAMETAGKHIEDEDLREAMKDCGLGTPATRAQIIERLIKVNYIERKAGKLLPTPKGQSIIAAIQDPALLSPELTGNWEKKLNDISNSAYNHQNYMNEIQTFTKSIIEGVKAATLPIIGKEEESIGHCPSCKSPVVETKLSFCCIKNKARACEFIVWKTIAGKKIGKTIVKKLLKDGKTDKLGGFKSKKGNDFETTLILKNNKIEFQF